MLMKSSRSLQLQSPLEEIREPRISMGFPDAKIYPTNASIVFYWSPGGPIRITFPCSFLKIELPLLSKVSTYLLTYVLTK